MGYTVALTGGICSGKSTVADAFSKLGINIIDADMIAHYMVEPNQPALNAIIEHFGKKILNKDGSLNRRKLSKRIFSRSDEKIWLNNLLHPIIYKKIFDLILEAKSPYIILVVPLLVETKMHNKADRVLLVDVSLENQINRTMKRDNISRKYVEQILSAQASREARIAVADDIIDNNGTIDSVQYSVASLHPQYLKYASQ